MSTRVDVTQATILESVLAELRTSLTLNESQCFEVADPAEIPPLPPGGDYFLTVAWGASDYSEDEQVPASLIGATVNSLGHVLEFSTLEVTIHTRTKLDRAGHDRYLLLEEKRGLLRLKPKVIGALVGKDLTDLEGNTFLRDEIAIRRSRPPEVWVQRSNSTVVGRLSLTFSCHFDLAIK